MAYSAKPDSYIKPCNGLGFCMYCVSNTNGFFFRRSCNSSMVCLNGQRAFSSPASSLYMQGNERTSHSPGSLVIKNPQRSCSCKRCMMMTIGVLRELTRFRMVVSNLLFTLLRTKAERASSGLMGSSMMIAPPNVDPSISGKNSSSASFKSLSDSAFLTSSTRPAPNPVTCPADDTA